VAVPIVGTPRPPRKQPGQAAHVSSPGRAAGPEAQGGALALSSSFSPLTPPVPPGLPPAAPAGLVTSATTGRDLETAASAVPDVLPGLGDLWRTSFPDPAAVADAADCYPGRQWLHRPGPVPRLLISPGVLRVEVADLAKRYDTDQRARRKRERDRQIDALAAMTGTPLVVRVSQRVITQWSRKSRSRMVRTLAELDYSAIIGSGRLPCFLTLTLPGAWETVAPSGKEFKRFCALLRRRWERAWGEPLIGIWKLEFQRRGAPHLHVFTVTPLGLRAGDGRARPAAGDGLHLTRWLGVVWADIVDHPDPAERGRHERAGTRIDYAEGLRMTDPKRVCVYFSKHGTFRDKEYQHIVPPAWRQPGKGPGRFWGYWGMSKVTEACELTFDERIAVARTMRRYGRAASRARGAMRECDVIRGKRFRKVHRRVPDRLQSCSGFLCVNDGPRLAKALSRLVMGDSDDEQAQ
jgi:hypothetical protein